MKDITILSCTNRPGSNTLKVSKLYQNLLNELGCNTQLLDFNQLPPNITDAEVFGRRSEAYDGLVKKFVIAPTCFVFVAPEYNGSYPGILKTFLDSLPPREWTNKKACLVGVSEGRAGNLRGMEHLTGVLQYLKMHVYHHKLPISLVSKVITAEGTFTEDQLKVCKAQLEGFLQF